MLLLASLSVQVSAWSQNSVSTITTSEELVKRSTVYAGEVVVDGVTRMKYLYSGDMTINDGSGIFALHDCLSGMADKDYAHLLKGNNFDTFDFTTESVGFALCSNAELAAAMDENWSSAQKVGALYYPGRNVTSATNSNLYDTDNGFKAVIDTKNEEGLAVINNPIDAGKSIVVHIGSHATDNVYYTVEEGQLVRHYDTNIVYDSEAVSVIYTKVELETPMAEMPLTFEAVEAGSITVNWEQWSTPSLDGIQYQLNGGEWTDAAWGTPITLAANDKVCFRGDNGTCYDEATWAGFHIESQNDCYVYGNMMSLIDKDGFATNATLTEPYAFFHLFQKSDYSANTTVRNHPTKDIVLPATTLTYNCYDGLFADCQGITRAPQLPATTLAEWCYCMMFSGTSITEAPALPATTLTNACYSDMFMNCTSLAAAPVLPAPTLVEGCYSSMFSGCSSLGYVKCLATDISADYCTTGWLSGVAATGTFVKAAATNGWPVGADESENVNGIPEGWTVDESVSLNSDGEGNYWATYYNNVAGYTADENTTVYTAKVSSDQSKVVLNEVSDKTVPAGNAVVLKSNVATATMTCAVGATGTLADNDLRGSATDTATPDNTYMLVKGSNGVGFYHWTETTIPAYRGYLTLSSSAAAREFMGITTDDDSPTAITTTTQTSKDDGYIYDLTGRRLSTTPRRGIYMKNGKKIVIN
ncbi:MAG: hypothetical protein SPK85_01335 [Prevotella sp.]|nr:hypothetical protein [Prevotella sp.]